MTLVVLDPGHGGKYPGAVAGSLREKDLNLAVATCAAKMLEAHGVQVTLTRTGDEHVPLSSRAAMAREARCLVSIHHNSADNPRARGHEVFYSVTGRGKDLAQAISERLKANSPLPSRGIKTRELGGRDYYYLIRQTDIPAVIVELGFLTNPEDARYLSSRAGQEDGARAVSQGITRWLEAQEAGDLVRAALALPAEERIDLIIALARSLKGE